MNEGCGRVGDKEEESKIIMGTRVKPPFSRVNGLQWPLNVWQLGASFVFILQTLLFLVYICPYEDISEPFGCFLVSFCSFTTAGTLALWLTRSG